MIFTTYGSVRGCCGHRHDLLSDARACVAADGGVCASQGGYSDRDVVIVGDDGYLYADFGQAAAEDGDHWIKSPGGSGGVKGEFTG